MSEITKQQFSFKPTSGDALDELLAQYILKTGCKVPIKKLGDGYYLFGTRKIYAKILNGKLVIRVGGGYMVIEEFISTYAEKELIKVESLTGINQDSGEQLSARDKFGNNVARTRSPDTGRMSQKDVVVQANPSIQISGTHHSRRFTTQQLNNLRKSGAAREIP